LKKYLGHTAFKKFFNESGEKRIKRCFIRLSNQSRVERKSSHQTGKEVINRGKARSCAEGGRRIGSLGLYQKDKDI